MSHLTPETLGALKDSGLSETARREAERHLESCAECRDALADLAAQDAMLATALAHDPGEAYFETFADRVSQRIRSEAAAAARTAPVRAHARSWWQVLLAPRGLAWAGSVAAVMIVSAIVLEQSRSPHLRSPQLAMEPAPAQQPADESQPPAAPEAQGTHARSAPAPATGRGEAHGGSSVGAAPGVARGMFSAAPPPEAGAAHEPNELRAAAPAPATTDQVAQESRREAGSPAANQIPIIPGGSREDRPAGAAARDERAPNASAAPLAANTKPQDAMQSTIHTLKERGVAPLARQSEESRSLGETKSLAGPNAIAPSVQAMKSAPPSRAAFVWPAELGPLAARADSLTAYARRSGDAGDHDAAAAAWEAIGPPYAATGSAAILEARCRAADARFEAWSLRPSPRRHELAAAAIRNVLAIVPDGVRRDYYAALLSRLD